MKYKMIAAILALTVMGWAQTAAQTSPSTPQQSTAPAEKGKCSCCDKMSADKADAKDGHACCAHHDMKAGDDKEMASCCGGKDAKSCMKDDKTAASCCKESCGKDKTAADCCDRANGKDCGKGCCASKKAEKPA